MIPQTELDYFIVTASDAFRCGEEERRSTGYIRLSYGVSHAEAASGPWRSDLVALWRNALERYRQQFPVK